MNHQRNSSDDNVVKQCEVSSDGDDSGGLNCPYNVHYNDCGQGKGKDCFNFSSNNDSAQAYLDSQVYQHSNNSDSLQKHSNCSIKDSSEEVSVYSQNVYNSNNILAECNEETYYLCDNSDCENIIDLTLSDNDHQDSDVDDHFIPKYVSDRNHDSSDSSIHAETDISDIDEGDDPNSDSDSSVLNYLLRGANMCGCVSPSCNTRICEYVDKVNVQTDSDVDNNTVIIIDSDSDDNQDDKLLNIAESCASKTSGNFIERNNETLNAEANASNKNTLLEIDQNSINKASRMKLVIVDPKSLNKNEIHNTAGIDNCKENDEHQTHLLVDSKCPDGNDVMSSLLVASKRNLINDFEQYNSNKNDCSKAMCTENVTNCLMEGSDTYIADSHGKTSLVAVPLVMVNSKDLTSFCDNDEIIKESHGIDSACKENNAIEAVEFSSVKTYTKPKLLNIFEDFKETIEVDTGNCCKVRAPDNNDLFSHYKKNKISKLLDINSTDDFTTASTTSCSLNAPYTSKVKEIININNSDSDMTTRGLTAPKTYSNTLEQNLTVGGIAEDSLVLESFCTRTAESKKDLIGNTNKDESTNDFSNTSKNDYCLIEKVGANIDDNLKDISSGSLDEILEFLSGDKNTVKSILTTNTCEDILSNTKNIDSINTQLDHKLTSININPLNSSTKCNSKENIYNNCIRNIVNIDKDNKISNMTNIITPRKEMSVLLSLLNSPCIGSNTIKTCEDENSESSYLEPITALLSNSEENKVIGANDLMNIFGFPKKDIPNVSIKNIEDITSNDVTESSNKSSYKSIYEERENVDSRFDLPSEVITKNYALDATVMEPIIRNTEVTTGTNNNKNYSTGNSNTDSSYNPTEMLTLIDALNLLGDDDGDNTGKKTDTVHIFADTYSADKDTRDTAKVRYSTFSDDYLKMLNNYDLNRRNDISTVIPTTNINCTDVNITSTDFGAINNNTGNVNITFNGNTKSDSTEDSNIFNKGNVIKTYTNKKINSPYNKSKSNVQTEYTLIEIKKDSNNDGVDTAESTLYNESCNLRENKNPPYKSTLKFGSWYRAFGVNHTTADHRNVNNAFNDIDSSASNALEVNVSESEMDIENDRYKWGILSSDTSKFTSVVKSVNQNSDQVSNINESDSFETCDAFVTDSCLPYAPKQNFIPCNATTSSSLSDMGVNDNHLDSNTHTDMDSGRMVSSVTQKCNINHLKAKINKIRQKKNMKALNPSHTSKFKNFIKRVKRIYGNINRPHSSNTTLLNNHSAKTRVKRKKIKKHSVYKVESVNKNNETIISDSDSSDDLHLSVDVSNVDTNDVIPAFSTDYVRSNINELFSADNFKYLNNTNSEMSDNNMLSSFMSSTRVFTDSELPNAFTSITTASDTNNVLSQNLNVNDANGTSKNVGLQGHVIGSAKVSELGESNIYEANFCKNNTSKISESSSGSKIHNSISSDSVLDENIKYSELNSRIQNGGFVSSTSIVESVNENAGNDDVFDDICSTYVKNNANNSFSDGLNQIITEVKGNIVNQDLEKLTKKINIAKEAATFNSEVEKADRKVINTFARENTDSRNIDAKEICSSESCLNYINVTTNVNVSQIQITNDDLKESSDKVINNNHIVENQYNTDAGTGQNNKRLIIPDTLQATKVIENIDAPYIISDSDSDTCSKAVNDSLGSKIPNNSKINRISINNVASTRRVRSQSLDSSKLSTFKRKMPMSSSSSSCDSYGSDNFDDPDDNGGDINIESKNKIKKFVISKTEPFKRKKKRKKINKTDETDKKDSNNINTITPRIQIITAPSILISNVIVACNDPSHNKGPEVQILNSTDNCNSTKNLQAEVCTNPQISPTVNTKNVLKDISHFHGTDKQHKHDGNHTTCSGVKDKMKITNTKTIISANNKSPILDTIVIDDDVISNSERTDETQSKIKCSKSKERVQKSLNEINSIKPQNDSNIATIVLDSDSDTEATQAKQPKVVGVPLPKPSMRRLSVGNIQIAYPNVLPKNLKFKVVSIKRRVIDRSNGCPGIETIEIDDDGDEDTQKNAIEKVKQLHENVDTKTETVDENQAVKDNVQSSSLICDSPKENSQHITGQETKDCVENDTPMLELSAIAINLGSDKVTRAVVIEDNLRLSKNELQCSLINNINSGGDLTLNTSSIISTANRGDDNDVKSFEPKADNSDNRYDNYMKVVEPAFGESEDNDNHMKAMDPKLDNNCKDGNTGALELMLDKSSTEGSNIKATELILDESDANGNIMKVVESTVHNSCTGDKYMQVLDLISDKNACNNNYITNTEPVLDNRKNNNMKVREPLSDKIASDDNVMVATLDKSIKSSKNMLVIEPTFEKSCDVSDDLETDIDTIIQDLITLTNSKEDGEEVPKNLENQTMHFVPDNVNLECNYNEISKDLDLGIQSNQVIATEDHGETNVTNEGNISKMVDDYILNDTADKNLEDNIEKEFDDLVLSDENSNMTELFLSESQKGYCVCYDNDRNNMRINELKNEMPLQIKNTNDEFKEHDIESDNKDEFDDDYDMVDEATQKLITTYANESDLCNQVDQYIANYQNTVMFTKGFDTELYVEKHVDNYMSNDLNSTEECDPESYIEKEFVDYILNDEMGEFRELGDESLCDFHLGEENICSSVVREIDNSILHNINNEKSIEKSIRVASYRGYSDYLGIQNELDCNGENVSDSNKETNKGSDIIKENFASDPVVKEYLNYVLSDDAKKIGVAEDVCEDIWNENKSSKYCLPDTTKKIHSPEEINTINNEERILNNENVKADYRNNSCHVNRTNCTFNNENYEIDPIIYALKLNEDKGEDEMYVNNIYNNKETTVNESHVFCGFSGTNMAVYDKDNKNTSNSIENNIDSNIYASSNAKPKKAKVAFEAIRDKRDTKICESLDTELGFVPRKKVNKVMSIDKGVISSANLGSADYVSTNSKDNKEDKTIENENIMNLENVVHDARVRIPITSNVSTNPNPYDDYNNNHEILNNDNISKNPNIMNNNNGDKFEAINAADIDMERVDENQCEEQEFALDLSKKDIEQKEYDSDIPIDLSVSRTNDETTDPNKIEARNSPTNKLKFNIDNILNIIETRLRNENAERNDERIKNNISAFNAPNAVKNQLKSYCTPNVLKASNVDASRLRCTPDRGILNSVPPPIMVF